MEPFITSDGVEVPLRPVGHRYVQMVMDKHPMPEHPTYEVTTAAGETEVHPHAVQYEEDGTTVKQATMQSEEEWDAWAAFKAAETQAIADRWQAAAEFLLGYCVAVDPPDVSEWAFGPEEWTYWGLPTPDLSDPKRLKLFWIENELIPDPEDRAALMARLYVIGGVVEKGRVKQLEAFFRATVERLAAGEPGTEVAG
jgi:hypothetical protein